MKKLFFLAFAGFFVAAAGAQQDAPLPEGMQESAQGAPDLSPKGVERMKRDMENYQKRQRDLQRRQLEELKSSNPDSYRALRESQQRTEKISQIMGRMHRGELSQDQAEEALIPVMRPMLRQDPEKIRERIGLLEEELAALKKAQSNPDFLVRRRVQEIVGKRKPARAGIY